jgi:hypothetical protein
MKFETLLLKTLFTASLLACVLTLGAMLVAPSALAGTAAAQATTTAANAAH